MHTKKKILALVLAVAAVLGLYFFLRPEKAAERETIPELRGKRNILVLGVDKRSGDTGRSDTLFVTMLDTAKDRVSLLSIPRDTLVEIPGRGWDKINHAYAFGGHKLSEETTENFLGIPLTNYIEVDFQGFIKLVDAIGGVDIDVEKPMRYQDPYDGEHGLVINLRPGRQHMDGTTAIQYVRYRDGEGDIGRVKRQQKFMQAVFARLRSINLLTRAPEIARTLYQSVDTDLSAGDLASLLFTFAKNMSGSSHLETAMVQGTPAYMDDISYWVPDMTLLPGEIARLEGSASVGNSQLYAAAKRKYDELLGTGSESSGGQPKKIQIKSKALEEAVERTKKMEKELSPRKNNFGGSAAGSTLPAPAPRRTFTATVVDCSGRGAGAQAARALSGAGFSVLRISSGSVQPSTQILINAVNSAAEERVRGLPFTYVLLRGAVSPDNGDVLVYVGQDFQM